MKDSPKVSVVSIGKSKKELKILKKMLSFQTYQNYEFVTSSINGIPNARNEAISKAKGEIIIFIDSDCKPLNNRWIEELVSELKNDIYVVQGGVLYPTKTWSSANFAVRKSVFDEKKFDESYAVAEDTEFFTYLSSKNMKMPKSDKAYVIQNREAAMFFSSKKVLSRAFKYGVSKMKIYHRYTGKILRKDDATSEKPFYGYIKDRIYIISSILLELMGLIVGYIYYGMKRFLGE